MALTTTQVQQVFLAITGRPAEGQAVAWGANSLNIAALANSVIDIRKGTDFANNKDTFIENLYQNLLGRASDAEGKEFWLKVLNDGASYGDVVAQFINAVLVQSQTVDLYTLQNKLGVAEKISAQVATFEGGAAAEAQLKNIMSNVNSNTTIESIQDNLSIFEGQYSKATSVTVEQGAQEATKGSEEHATTYNATLDYSKEGDIQINGSTNFGDTLNLTVKGTDNDDTFRLSGDISNVATINLDLSDAKIKSSTITTDNVTGLKYLNIKGTSADTVTVNTKGVTVDTGAGNDTITVNVASTIKAGAGNDTINVSGASGVTVSVDGGAGNDTVVLGIEATHDFKKLSLTSVEVLSGKGELSYTTLNDKSFKLASATELSVSAKDKSGIDLSSINMDTDAIDGKIAINDVAKGKITLSAKDADITETIKLGANAEKVTFENVDSGDKVNVKDIAAIKSAAGTATNFESAAGAITTNKAYFVEISDKNISQLEANDVITAATNVGLQKAQSKKALLAVEGKDGIAFYTLTTDNQSSFSANAIDVQLIGLAGNDVTNTTLTLA